MSEILSSSVGSEVVAANAASQNVIDLAVIKQGAKDFLTFVDDTKDIFFAYLYHATGSRSLADTLLLEIYLRVLGRALSLWWFGNLTFPLLLRTAQRAVQEIADIPDTDLDSVYLPTLGWLSQDERKSVSTFHDALWTLPSDEQSLLILLYLIGLSPERIAKLYGVPLKLLMERINNARILLFKRWDPPDSLHAKLESLVFLPTLSLDRESQIRFALVEKYNALRMRRYQWLVIGGLLAVFSNFLVASFLAFVVIIQPPTSLRSTQADLVAFDAAALQDEQHKAQIDGGLGDIYRNAQGLAASDSVDALSRMGLIQLQPTLTDRAQKLKNIQQLRQAVDHVLVAMAHSFGHIASAIQYWIRW